MADLYETTVRAFFRKKGRVKYISHLDMMRSVTRALKRSGLPVWHTLGFNPHIYITFALPLALGYESECESMDFRLIEALSMEEVVRRLDGALPEGIQVYRARPAGMKPEAIRWADYEIAQEFDHTDAKSVLEAFSQWCARPEVPVVKRTKKGEKTVDVKPEFSAWDMQARGNTLSMTMRAAAGTTLNINPTLILDTFAAESGIKADWASVLRTAILTAELKDFA